MKRLIYFAATGQEKPKSISMTDSVEGGEKEKEIKEIKKRLQGGGKIEGKVKKIIDQINKIQEKVKGLGTKVAEKFKKYLKSSIGVNLDFTKAETTQESVNKWIEKQKEKNIDTLKNFDKGLDLVMLRVQFRKQMATTLKGLEGEDGLTEGEINKIGLALENQLDMAEGDISSNNNLSIDQFKHRLEIIHEITKYAKMRKAIKEKGANSIEKSIVISAKGTGIAYPENNGNSVNFFKYWTHKNSSDQEILYAIDTRGYVQSFNPFQSKKFGKNPWKFVYKPNTNGNTWRDQNFTESIASDDQIRSAKPKSSDLNEKQKKQLIKNMYYERAFISAISRNYTEMTEIELKEYEGILIKKFQELKKKHEKAYEKSPGEQSQLLPLRETYKYFNDDKFKTEVGRIAEKIEEEREKEKKEESKEKNEAKEDGKEKNKKVEKISRIPKVNHILEYPKDGKIHFANIDYKKNANLSIANLKKDKDVKTRIVHAVFINGKKINKDKNSVSISKDLKVLKLNEKSKSDKKIIVVIKDELKNGKVRYERISLNLKNDLKLTEENISQYKKLDKSSIKYRGINTGTSNKNITLARFRPAPGIIRKIIKGKIGDKEVKLKIEGNKIILLKKKNGEYQNINPGETLTVYFSIQQKTGTGIGTGTEYKTAINIRISIAEEIANFKGDTFYLDDITYLDTKTAQELAGSNIKNIFPNSLIKTKEEIIKFKKQCYEIEGSKKEGGNIQKKTIKMGNIDTKSAKITLGKFKEKSNDINLYVVGVHLGNKNGDLQIVENSPNIKIKNKNLILKAGATLPIGKLYIEVKQDSKGKSRWIVIENKEAPDIHPDNVKLILETKELESYKINKNTFMTQLFPKRNRIESRILKRTVILNENGQNIENIKGFNLNDGKITSPSKDIYLNGNAKRIKFTFEITTKLGKKQEISTTLDLKLSGKKVVSEDEQQELQNMKISKELYKIWNETNSFKEMTENLKGFYNGEQVDRFVVATIDAKTGRFAVNNNGFTTLLTTQGSKIIITGPGGEGKMEFRSNKEGLKDAMTYAAALNKIVYQTIYTLNLKDKNQFDSDGKKGEYYSYTSNGEIEVNNSTFNDDEIWTMPESLRNRQQDFIKLANATINKCINNNIYLEKANFSINNDKKIIEGKDFSINLNYLNSKYIYTYSGNRIDWKKIKTTSNNRNYKIVIPSNILQKEWIYSDKGSKYQIITICASPDDKTSNLPTIIKQIKVDIVQEYSISIGNIWKSKFNINKETKEETKEEIYTLKNEIIEKTGGYKSEYSLRLKNKSDKKGRIIIQNVGKDFAYISVNQDGTLTCTFKDTNDKNKFEFKVDKKGNKLYFSEK